MTRAMHKPIGLYKLIFLTLAFGVGGIGLSTSTQAIAQTQSTQPSSSLNLEEDLNMTATLTAVPTNYLLTPSTIADIDTYLDALYQTGRFSGNILISQGTETILTRSYGLANHEHHVANTADTKFRIGSVTKQFTAVAVLQLQERGQLDLHAPISTYLSDYPNGDKITAHHLLSHTSGIPEYLNPELFPDLTEWMRLPSTLEQLIARFKDLPLEFEPGSEFKYSNSGYVLLTQLIETISGQPYADYMQTQIFQPLQLENTGYEVPKAIIPNLAQGYFFVGTDIHIQAEPIDMSLPQGAGGLYSTLEDLAKWNQWLYGEPSQTSVTSSVLSEDGLALLTTPIAKMDSHRDGPDAFYGYGLVLDTQFDRQRIHHNGGINGFLSSLIQYPTENLTLAILTNFENTVPAPISQDLTAILFGEPYELPTLPKAVDIDPSLYEKYVGTYQLLPQMQVNIGIEDDQLVGQATGQDSFVLYPSTETDFFAQVVDIKLTFSLSEEGTITGFTLFQAGQALFAPKVEPQ